MQIAPGINADEWKNLDFQKPGSWGRGVEIFEGRIRRRFTDAIDVLITDDQKKSARERRWGFAILAIDCLLVEALQAFREGMIDTEGESKNLSVRFLTKRPEFSKFFPDENIAIRFYREFRCGLAHNAQVFGTGRILSVGALATVDAVTGKIVINRTEFHRALVRELDTYVAELRDLDAKNDDLRKNFRMKMDFIAAEQIAPKKPRKAKKR